MFVRSFAALVVVQLIGCGADGGFGGGTIVGTWKCSGDAIEGDDGSSWQPKAEGLVVPESMDVIITGGFECSEEDTELAGSGDETGVDVAGKCDTKLGYDTFHSMSLTLDSVDPNAASWSGDLTSVVDDVVYLSEGFDWENFDCSRVE